MASAEIIAKKMCLPSKCGQGFCTKKNAQSIDWAFRNKSLTMTYFHTGIRTIIGAKAFHGPVRDGKEWYHFAMVIRHNFLSS